MQDTVVLWSKSSTLDRKVEGSNPATANFWSGRPWRAKNERRQKQKTGAPANDHWRASALKIVSILTKSNIP